MEDNKRVSRKLLFYGNLAYFLTLLGISIYHVPLPLYFEHYNFGSAAQLREKYNEKVREIEHALGTEERDTIRKLREVVVHSKYVGYFEARKALRDPLGSRDEIARLYGIVREKLGKARKVFLIHSSECNAGLFCSIFLPMLVISATNTWSLRQ